MLREGDFYNVLIVKLIGDNLKHRTQVKQLRKALAEHTKDKSIELPSHYLFKFLETTDYMEFKRMYEAISEINSIELLKQLDSHFISILSTASAGTKYEKRLKLLIGTIKQKLTQLNSSVKNSKDIQLGTILGNSLASISLDEFLKERNKLVMIAFWRDVERIKDPLEDATYVGDDGPSDDDALFEEGLSIGYSNSEDMIKIHKKYFYNLILSIKRNSIEIMEDYIACTNTHKNSNDPERIRLYRRARRELMRIQNEIFQRIHDEDLQDFKRSEYFLKLIEKDVFRDTLSYSSAPVTKNFTTQSMTSIPNKSKSDLFEKNISEEKTTDQRSTIVVKAVEDAFSEIMKYSNASYKDGDEDFGGGLHRTPSYKAVPTTSISTPSKPSISSSIGSLDLLDKSASTNTLTISLKRDLFGDPDPASLFGNDNDNCSGNTAVTGGARSRGKLFDDDDDDNGMDSDIDSFNYETSPLTNSMELDSSVVFGEGSEISTAAGGDSEEENEVYLAAPGNLRLTEEITKLEQEIEKLTEQLTILTPLLKKAELTNNVGELKILRKSKLSLDREISYKELQKQQYIVQENDNSLYGKSRVSIQSYITGSDSGKEVTLYIVEVQKLSNDNPDVVTAGWIVARRFSQFYKLNEYLKARYPFINTISFPKRAVLVLKFQQRQIVEMRKIALSEYLQEIIAIPQVCSDRAFRSFLSSENFNIRKDQLFEESLNKESMTSLSRSGVEMLANKLYGQTKLLLMPLMEAKIISNNNKSDSDMDKKLLENLAEMQNELKQYDGSGGVKTSFVKPICDILVSVFKLNTSKTWLRGRALLAILQQIFGTTIERKVYEMVEQQLKNEETVLDLLTLFQEIVFPNGKFKDPPVIRTLYQRSISKQEAKVLFGIFFQETCSKLFGLSNTMYASTSIFDMLQNDYLNEHLLFEILEVLIDELFRDHER